MKLTAEETEVWNLHTKTVSRLRPGMIYPFNSRDDFYIRPARPAPCHYCGGHAIDKAQRCAGCGAAR